VITTLAAILAAYAIGSLPVAWLAARVAGVDLRHRGSGNPGASNVIQSVSPVLGVAVGIAQIAQGLLAVLLARAIDLSPGAQVAAGSAAVIANDWNPWLRFTGGRGIGVTLGVLLGVSWVALAAFVLVAVFGRLRRAAPQGVALALVAAPLGAGIAGDARATVIGVALISVIAFVKRLTANEAPSPSAPRPDVWINRLWYDRDIRDREAWLRRGARHA